MKFQHYIFPIMLLLMSGVVFAAEGNVLLLHSDTFEITPEFSDAVVQYRDVLEDTRDITVFVEEVSTPDRKGVREVVQPYLLEEDLQYVVILGSTESFPVPTGDVGCSEQVRSDALHILQGNFLPIPGVSVSRIPDYGTSSSIVTQHLLNAVEVHKQGGILLEQQTRLGFEPHVCLDATCRDAYKARHILTNHNYVSFAGMGGYHILVQEGDRTIIDRQQMGELEFDQRPIFVGYFPPAGFGRIHTNPNFATEALKQGAIAFLGRTQNIPATTYMTNPFDGFLRGGYPIGQAFGAGQHFGTESCEFRPNALGVAHFGDPTIRIRQASATIDIETQEVPSEISTVQEHVLKPTNTPHMPIPSTEPREYSFGERLFLSLYDTFSDSRKIPTNCQVYGSTEEFLDKYHAHHNLYEREHLRIEEDYTTAKPKIDQYKVMASVGSLNDEPHALLWLQRGNEYCEIDSKNTHKIFAPIQTAKDAQNYFLLANTILNGKVWYGTDPDRLNNVVDRDYWCNARELPSVEETTPRAVEGGYELKLIGWDRPREELFVHDVLVREDGSMKQINREVVTQCQKR